MLRILSLCLTLLITPLSAAADPFQRGPHTYQVPHAPSGWACTPAHQAAYDASGLPRGDSLQTLRAIDRALRRGIHYSADNRPAPWPDHTLAVTARQRAVGDCKSYAHTAIIMALCAGVPADKLGVAISNPQKRSGGPETSNHTFAFYVEAGVNHAFADTFRQRVEIASSRRDGVRMWQMVPALQRAGGDFFGLPQR